MLIPLSVALISSFLAGELFRFYGSTIKPVWLVMKIVFALCTTVFLLSVINIKGELFKKKQFLLKKKSDSI
jgi:hypothetical protein